MGDHEVKQVDLSLTQQKQMVEFFKIQIKVYSLKEALEHTAEKYSLTYSKVHHDLSEYF